MFGRNMPAIGWIQIAYQVKEFQIVGPAWISAEKFDIEAKTETPPSQSSQIYAMLQSLLAERFNLKLHRETRESTVYALVLARNGLKMKQSALVGPNVAGRAVALNIIDALQHVHEIERVPIGGHRGIGIRRGRISPAQRTTASA